MTRITTITFALLAAAGLTLAGCNKRDDMPPTGAGPGTTTTPSDTMPGGTSTTPGGGTTTPGSTPPADTGSTGTPGSMSPTTPMPSASAASQ
jgi:hypothetical protein